MSTRRWLLLGQAFIRLSGVFPGPFELLLADQPAPIRQIQSPVVQEGGDRLQRTPMGLKCSNSLKEEEVADPLHAVQDTGYPLFGGRHQLAVLPDGVPLRQHPPPLDQFPTVHIL